MLIENNGITIDSYYVPPFSVSKGEVVVLFLHGGGHFYDLSGYLTNIFSGKSQHSQVNISQPFRHVKYIRESAIRSWLFPVTIGEYIKRYAGPNKAIAEKIYTLGYLDKNTRVYSLNGDRRKTLCLYIALSHSQNVVLDMGGIDPVGAERIFNILQENADNGGAAIILDNFPDFRNQCSRFIEMCAADQQPAKKEPEQ